MGMITLERRGPAAWLTIDNLPKRNAVSLDMWRQLDAALQTISPDTRCIVFQGAGSEAFASGADISEFMAQRRSPEDVAVYDSAANAALKRLHQMEQPTIAMIEGYCFGAGVALALCCDIRFAAHNSLFCVPAARLGLGYGPEGVKQLLDVVSVPVAMDIMISARRYDATAAREVGLVNHVYPAPALRGEVDAYVAAIAANAPLTVRAIKATIKELSRINPTADLGRCRKLVAACFASDDYAEGAAAFAEKRQPCFKGA